MKTAIVMHDRDHASSNDTLMQVIIIDFDEENGMGIEHDYLNIKNINQICVWLASKEVNTMFIPDNIELQEEVINRMGIKIRRHSELDKQEIVKLFLLNE